MLYAFLGIKTRIQDITIMFFDKKNGAIRTNNISNYHLLMFIAGKVSQQVLFVNEFEKKKKTINTV